MKINQRGFTLLIAALVSSVVLLLAASIFSIANKQVVLASLSEGSQFAFFAADTAAECALFWDINPATSIFAGPNSANTAPASLTGVTCDGSALQNFILPPGGPIYAFSSSYKTFTTTFNLPLNGGLYCADVSVQKCQGTITDSGFCCYQEKLTSSGTCDGATSNVLTVSTQIRANGYNSPALCSGSNPSLSTLQRSVVLNY